MVNQDKILENIESILDYFEIEYKSHPNKITFACPIHFGDKTTGASILTNHCYGVGQFRCWSRGCHDEYGKTVLGFCRGVLSVRSNKKYSYNDVVDWLEKFLNVELREELSDEHSHKKRTTQLSWSFAKSNYDEYRSSKEINQLTRQTVLEHLSIPSEYFIGRGYKKDTLLKYDIGLCTNKAKLMADRVVVPVYSDDHKYMIGCSGRTLKGQCILCKKYHGENEICPTSSFDEYKCSKWVHSIGFDSQSNLYNYWYARPHIEKTKTVTVCEGPADCWRFEEAGIHNSLALFGAHFNDGQAEKLEKLHIHNLIIATDNDEAGEQVRERIKSKVGRLYNIYDIRPTAKDIGESSIEEVKSLFSVLPAGYI